MTIRKLQKSDAALAAELIKQLTQNIIEPENLTGRLENLAQAENCQYFVAEEGAGLVGFAGLVWYVIPSKGLMGWGKPAGIKALAPGCWRLFCG